MLLDVVVFGIDRYPSFVCNGCSWKYANAIELGMGSPGDSARRIAIRGHQRMGRDMGVDASIKRSVRMSSAVENIGGKPQLRPASHRGGKRVACNQCGNQFGFQACARNALVRVERNQTSGFL